MMNKDVIERKIIEDTLRQENEAVFEQKVTRYLKMKPHTVTAGTHFAPVSAEVTLLFRDGHYYGCIALTQAVAEAVVHFMCKRNCFRPKDDFEKNVKTLVKRGFIDDDMKRTLLKIWKKRNDYHHLNHNIEQDRDKLENLAFEKARLLADIEKEIFAYTNVNGILHPKYPKYWDIKGDRADIFLRIDT